MIGTNDQKRLKAIIARIKPPNSLAARLDALSDDDRAEYERYSERLSKWIKATEARSDMDDIEPAARPYARMIDGYGPRLSARISNALYPMSVILKTDSDDTAARKYMDFIQS